MLGSEWIFALVFVVFFYGAGKFEARSGGSDYSLLWASLSIALSALVVLVFKGKPPALFLCQVGLFAEVGIVRALWDKQ